MSRAAFSGSLTARTSLLTRLDAIAGDIEIALTRHRFLVVVLLTILYAVCVIGAAAAKPFWFDEIYTILASRLSPSELWRALSEALDLNPPGFYLVTKFFNSVFSGPGLIVTRLSSMIGYWVASFCVAVYVSRRCGILLGITSALILAMTPAFPYAFETRAFGVVLASCGVAAICWTAIDSRRLAPVGLALAIATAISMHYYAVLILIAFGLAEITYSVRHQRVRWQVWAAMVIGLLPLAAYVPLIRSASEYFKGFVRKPESVSIRELYDFLFSDSQILLFFWLIAAPLFADRKGLSEERSETAAEPVPPEELVLMIGLALLPAVCWIISMLAVGQIQLRYALSATFGFAALLAFFMHAARIRKGYVLLLCGCILFQLSGRAAKSALGMVRHRMVLGDRHQDGPSLDELAATSSKPLVLARCLQYLELHMLDLAHAPKNMVCFADPVLAYKTAQVNSVDLAVTTLNRWFPFPLRKPEEFIAQHREFLFYAPVSESGWMKEYMRQKGAVWRLVKSDLHYELFDVSLPADGRQ